MKRIVFLVEGEGDFTAVPSLASRWLSDNPEGYAHIYLDTNPLQIGGLEKVSGRPHLRAEWLRFLKLAYRTRPNVGAIFAILDGDADRFESKPFCAVEAATTLAERAKEAGAGVMFSFGIVLLCKEYESILIASAAQLPGVAANIVIPASPESIRGAKEWLGRNLTGGYSSVSHQNELTKAVKDWAPVRESNRSFRRFENALHQLVSSVSRDTHIVTPAMPPPVSDATAE